MNRAPRLGGFTLAELVMAAAASSVMLAGMAFGVVALQRGFSAAEFQVECQEDQLRVVDFITRDLHRASVASTTNDNRRLDLLVPASQAASGVAGLRLPVVTDGVVRYAAQQIAVSYWIEGTRFLRRENGADTVLSTRIEEFFAWADALPLVKLQIAFTPSFSPENRVAKRGATRVITTVCVRNTAGRVQ